MPPYGGRVSGRAACPFRRGVASSEAETIRSPEGRLPTLERGGVVCSLEGRLATLERGGDAGRLRGSRREALERGGDCPAGSRGVRMGRTMYLDRGLGFFESFPFLWIGGGL